MSSRPCWAPRCCGAARSPSTIAATRPNLVPLGPAAPPAADVPVALDRRWVEADLRISTGLVEPHLFAGFSGGPKLVAIGTAGLDTVMALHNGRRVGEPRATWGVVEGNPVHDAIRAVAALAPPHFSLEVVLDSGQAPHPRRSPAPPRPPTRRRPPSPVETTMRRVDRRFPLVITSSGGYPLDQNFYQAIKGIVGGRGHRHRRRHDHPGGRMPLRSARTPACTRTCCGPAKTSALANARILESDQVVPDQWQLQVQARIQARARVLVQVIRALAADIGTGPAGAGRRHRRVRQAARDKDPALPIAVLPHGPYCVPFLAERLRRLRSQTATLGSLGRGERQHSDVVVQNASREDST